MFNAWTHLICFCIHIEATFVISHPNRSTTSQTGQLRLLDAAAQIPEISSAYFLCVLQYG